MGGIYNAIALGFNIRNATITGTRQTQRSVGPPLAREEFLITFSRAYASLVDTGLVAGLSVLWPVKNKWFIGADIRGALGLVSVPKKYEDFAFLGFSPHSKNINFETGLRVAYALK